MTLYPNQVIKIERNNKESMMGNFTFRPRNQAGTLENLALNRTSWRDHGTRAYYHISPAIHVAQYSTILEPETWIYKWLFQLDDSKSLHGKWFKKVVWGSRMNSAQRILKSNPELKQRPWRLWVSLHGLCGGCLFPTPALATTSELQVALAFICIHDLHPTVLIEATTPPPRWRNRGHEPLVSWVKTTAYGVKCITHDSQPENLNWYHHRYKLSISWIQLEPTHLEFPALTGCQVMSRILVVSQWYRNDIVIFRI